MGALSRKRRQGKNFWNSKLLCHTSVLVTTLWLVSNSVCSAEIVVETAKDPFNLRASFPTAPRPSITFNPERQNSPISGSSINPLGFNFARVVSASQSPSVHRKGVPLAWVNLPLFDTPIFSQPLTLLPTTVRASIPRRIIPGLVKSDWDGGSDSEVIQSTIPPTTVRPSFVGRNPTRALPIFLGRVVPLSVRGPEMHTAPTTGRTPEEKYTLREAGTTLQLPNQQGQSDEDKDSITTVQTKLEDPHTTEADSLVQPSSLFATDSRLEPVIHRLPKHIDTTAAASRNDDRSIRHHDSQTSHSTASSSFDTLAVGQDDRPHYKYEYSVSNRATMDVKTHAESRDGDTVRGEYSILEADGYIRVVRYIADANGFRATVKRVKSS